LRSREPFLSYREVGVDEDWDVRGVEYLGRDAAESQTLLAFVSWGTDILFYRQLACSSSCLVLLDS
jgi:hypothetical protein